MIGGVLFGIYDKDAGRYIQFLDLIVERYNESEHSSYGGKCPRDVYCSNVTLKEGDKVRVSVMKCLFSKESRLN